MRSYSFVSITFASFYLFVLHFRLVDAFGSCSCVPNDFPRPVIDYKIRTLQIALLGNGVYDDQNQINARYSLGRDPEDFEYTFYFQWYWRNDIVTAFLDATQFRDFSDETKYFTSTMIFDRCCYEYQSIYQTRLQFSKTAIYGVKMIFGGNSPYLVIPEIVKVQSFCDDGAQEASKGSKFPNRICIDEMIISYVGMESAAFVLRSPIQLLDVDLNTADSYQWFVVGSVTNAAGTISQSYDPITQENALKSLIVDKLIPGTTYYFNFEVYEAGHTNIRYSVQSSVNFVTAGVPTPYIIPESFGLNVMLPGHDPWTVMYNVSDFSNPTNPLRVYGAEKVQAPPEVLRLGSKVSSLKPGTNYSVEYQVFKTDPAAQTSSGRLFVVTKCSCGDSVSDAPVIVDDRLIQKEGIIYFKFFGYSVCGTAYAFTRQKKLSNDTYTAPKVFTSNFHFYQDVICPTLYSPEESAADDLFRSNLEVGATYRYNIRAVANKYQGQIETVEHTVRWESSVAGLVNLGDRNGNLPVAGVRVYWELHNLQGTAILNGTTYSDNGGAFLVPFNLEVDFENDQAYPMNIQFFKETVVNETYKIQHEFSCDNGAILCSEKATTIYLKHLDFEVPVEAEDHTVIPVSGKVYIAGTNLDDLKRPWGQEGCPIRGASVCLIDMSHGSTADAELACTETNEHGGYFLPGTIGTLVSIRVSYKLHEFFYVPAGKVQDNANGFKIEAGKRYELNNFEDRSKVPLSIQVVGGLCNFSLGVTMIRYQIAGCPWNGLVVEMLLQSHEFSMPSHNLVVGVDTIVAHMKAQLDPINVDLSNVLMEAANKPTDAVTMPTLADSPLLQEANNNQQVKSIRFQYNGIPELRAVFSKNENKNSCKNINHVDGKVPAKPITDFIVLPSEDLMDVTIFVQQNFGFKQICTLIDPSTTVTIYNNLGLADGDKTDDAYRAILPAEVRDLMQVCNRGCNKNITSEEGMSAFAKLTFVTGRPNRISPYTKTMRISASNNAQEIVITAIIIGQYKLDDSYTVALPTYEPIMIIRDPPGGGSFSFYQDVETTIRVENIAIQEYSGFDRDTNVLGGVNWDQKVCAIFFSTGFCTNTNALKAKTGYKGKSNDLRIDELFQVMKSGGFTTTWSYETSKNPFFVGENSDVFVVPSLNVKYSQADIVEWNSAACDVWKRTNTTFNLAAPENGPALAFLSAYEIKNVEIDTLNKLVTDFERQLINCTYNNNCEEVQEKIDAAKDGIEGWNNALKQNELAKQLAISNRSNLVQPIEWFSKLADFNSTNTVNTTGMNVNSGLVSSRLQSKAILRPFYKDKMKKDDVGNMNTIKFSGGGTTLTYSVSSNQYRELEDKVGGRNENTKKTDYLGAYAIADATITAGVADVDLNLGEGLTLSRSHLQANREGSTMSVGFTLSDPNIGDIFDVEVYFDPRYGSFVFNTVGGHSMCPCEAGTRARAVAQLEVTSRPPQIVLPTDPMVFDLKLKNGGDYPSPFVLNYDYRTILSGGLSFYPRLPITIERIDPGETVDVMLSLTRGRLYDYEAVTAILEVGCEGGLDVEMDAVNGARMAKVQLYNNKNAAQENILKFAQPCPQVYLGEQIQIDQYFASTTTENRDGNIVVSVRNPMSSTMSFREAVVNNATTRLESIQLLYRRKGDTGDKNWEYGQRTEKGVTERINFAVENLENAYGYASVKWDVNGIADGQYEMMVRSVCTPIQGAPDQFNFYSTEILEGVIDRTAPKVFGFPTPEKELQVGDEIEVEFTEEIDCNVPFVFDIKIEVLETGDKFNKDTLLCVCESRFISIRFDETTLDMETLLGKNIKMSLSGVADANGNLIEGSVYSNLLIVPWKTQDSSQRRRLSANQDIGVDTNIFEEVQWKRDLANRQVRAEIDKNILTHIEHSERLLMESVNEELQMRSMSQMFNVILALIALVASFVFASWSYALYSL